MLVDDTDGILGSHPAVVVCAIVYWLLGGLWFDRLFSKQRMALEHMSEAQASSTNPVWIWPFILTFFLESLDRICSCAGVHLAQRKHGRARRRERHPLVAWHCRPDCLHHVHVRNAADATVRNQPVLEAILDALRMKGRSGVAGLRAASAASAPDGRSCSPYGQDEVRTVGGQGPIC